MLTDTNDKEENIRGWKEKRKAVAKHLLLTYMQKTEDFTPDNSNTEGSEHEFINADAAALSPNAKTPPYDSHKLVCVENELGQPRSTGGEETGISWFFIHCVLCPKLLSTMHFRMMRNGGLFFLIPLTISVGLVAAPLAFMELALGQYTSKQAAHIFARISPISAGIGYTLIIMRFLLILSSKTEHRFCSLFWEFIGSTFFERRNVECLMTNSEDCHLPHACKSSMVFHRGRCYDIKDLAKKGNLTTESSIYLYTRQMLAVEVYSDDYALPIPLKTRVLEPMPGCHRVDGVFVFFMACLIFSKIGISKFSKASPFIVMFSLFATLCTLFSLLPSGYFRVFNKLFTVLDNDPSYLLNPDTWIEAVVVSLLLLSVADGTLHSLGASSTFGNDILQTVIEITIFNLTYVVIASIAIGMTTIIGLELEYRQNRRFDVPSGTLRALMMCKMESLDFATPLYFFGVANPYSKAAALLMVVSMALLSTAYHLLALEDVLMMLSHFFPSLLKVNPSIVQHCVASTVFIAVSYSYFNLAYTEGIEWCFSALLTAICVVVLWECACVGWNYSTYRFLVNIRTMGTTASRVIAYEQHISLFLHFFWRYVIPVVLLITAITGLTSKTVLMEFSWTSITTAFICSLPMLYAIEKISSTLFQHGVMSSLFRPTDRWGPLSIQHRKISEYDEKAARITI